MYRYLVFGAILIGLTTIQASPCPYFAQCSYTGDPHLKPYPAYPGAYTGVFWCQNTGWEILLQNPWVVIYVYVGPHPYVTLNYFVVFLNGAGGLLCGLLGSSGITTCPTGSGIIRTGSYGAYNYRHTGVFYLNVNIRTYPYGTGYRYDFFITQSFNLIYQSTGVCIKYKCSPEGIVVNPAPVAIRLCDAHVAAAQRRAINPVADDLAKNIAIACYNDVTLTFNPQFAQTAAVLMANAGILDVDTEKLPDAVDQLEGNIQGIVADAEAQVSDIIGPRGCVQQKTCLVNNNAQAGDSIQATDKTDPTIPTVTNPIVRLAGK